MKWIEKWKELPVIGKIGLVILIIVPMGFIIMGIIAFVYKLTKK